MEAAKQPRMAVWLQEQLQKIIAQLDRSDKKEHLHEESCNSLLLLALRGSIGEDVTWCGGVLVLDRNGKSEIQNIYFHE